MSYKPAVKTGSDDKWYYNSLVFNTHDEAYASARDLAGRWLLVTDYTANESADHVNYAIIDNQQVPI